MSRLAMFGTLAALLAGCPSDGGPKTSNFDGVTLTITASNACGKNVLPVPTVPELTVGDVLTMAVTVRGVDPSNSSGTVTGATPVEIFVGQPDEEGISEVPNTGVFLSKAAEIELPQYPELGHVSHDVKFTGFTARDEFHCLKGGTHFLHARIRQYKAGGVGEPADVFTLRDRGFPIRCVSRPVYEEECGRIGDLGPLEFGPDVADAGDAGDAEAGIDMEILPSWALEYIPLDNGEEVIGIRGAAGGRPFQVELKFLVKELDLPVPGVEVEFSLGDTHPPNVAIDPAAGAARTDQNGVATVTLIAGGTPGVATVSATARRDFEGDTPEGGCASAEECGGDTRCEDGACDICRDQVCYQRQFQDSISQVITIRAGIPSHRGFHFVCENTRLAAFDRRREAPNGEDVWGGLVNKPGTDCFVQVADRVNGRVDTATQVFFLTEAGTVTQAAGINDDGRATTHLRLGRPPPQDVEPWDYEVQAGYPGPYNPRDGLVRLVAVTRGEEDFLDVDGDKVWNDAIDLQHPWHQLSDPFIDYDDDGEFDDGVEEWRDGDDSGDFTFANDDWDADLEVWTSVTVLWIGELAVPAPLPPEEEGRYLRFGCGENDDGCSPIQDENGRIDTIPPIISRPGSGFYVWATFRDQNGNCLGQGDSSAKIAIDGEWRIAGEPEDVNLFHRCFDDATGTVLGARLEWFVFNTMPDIDGLFVRAFDELTVELDYETAGGNNATLGIARHVITEIGDPPPPDDPGN